MANHATARSGVRVLIVGCGQLGSRHLQAVASLPQVQDIEVVDPNPEALQLGRQRLAEVSGQGPSPRVRWLASLEDASRGGSLCIIATQAQGRLLLFRQVVEALGYPAFILEKLVVPSVAECEDLLEMATRSGVSVWVNCQTRAYPFHQRIKAHLDPNEPLVLSVVGGNIGLATNGIHKVDLFVFFDGATRLESGGTHVDSMLHRTSRGHVDLSGTLYASTDKGSRLMLTYAAHHRHPEQISIGSPRYRCFVDHKQGWAAESEASSGWAWRLMHFEEDIRVSRLTRRFVSEILASGRCDLPTLEESLISHRFILGELQPHFSRLLEQELECLPVT